MLRVALSIILFCASSSALADEFQDRLDAYNVCIISRIEALKDVCEPVEHVAVAVVNGCPDATQRVLSVAIRNFGPEKARELVSRMKVARRDFAITKLIEHRAASPC